MATEFPDISAMDFLILMDDPYCLDLIHQEYNTIELTRRSFEEPDNEVGRGGCLQLAHQFFRCLKTEERYHGASFIDGYDTYKGQRKYICISNPEEEDCEKFWELAWRREVTTIVKTSRRAEEDSYQYWSPTEGSEIECGGFRVKTLKISEEPRFTLTELRLSDRADRERQIQHYQYTAWRDSVEDDRLMFLSFVCSLNETYTISERKQLVGTRPGAVMVHCSDGISCSAVYCILDICVTQFNYKVHWHRFETVPYFSSEAMESFVISEVFGAVNSKGNNFFHDICRHGCVSLLLRAGWWLDHDNESLLRKYNFEGRQCVHIVAQSHRGQKAVQFLEILVQMGADLNAPDRTSGSTALHIAVGYQDYELVTWICQQTAVNLEASDYGGLTVYEVAWKRDDLKMMDIFREFGADCHQPNSSESESECSENDN